MPRPRIGAERLTNAQKQTRRRERLRAIEEENRRLRAEVAALRLALGLRPEPDGKGER